MPLNFITNDYMNSIGTITQRLLDEFGSKPMTIRTESNVLIIRAGSTETRFVNWQDVALEEIVRSVHGCLHESTDSRVLLRG
jgi:hypothetical protein